LEDQNFSLSSFVCDEVSVSHKIEKFDKLCPSDPPMSNCVSTRGPKLDYASPLCHLA